MSPMSAWNRSGYTFADVDLEGLALGHGWDVLDARALPLRRFASEREGEGEGRERERDRGMVRESKREML
eukprot:1632523-Rhodomonas_salina.3